jgi:transmembrane sensor
MDRKHFKYLLQRYVNDQATDEEVKELVYFVNTGKYNDLIKKEIDRNLSDDFFQLFEENQDMPRHKADEILLDILGSTLNEHQEKSNIHSLSRDQKRTKFTTNWKWVAAAAIIILTGLFWGNWHASDLEDIQETAMQEIITNRGERTSLILSDGSEVTLNADSRLQIPQDYGQNTRTLILNGEAFFDVESNPELPFKVYVDDNIYTEVLGTRFNVRSYDEIKSDDIRVDVVVEEGRVRLGSENKSQPNSVEISAGQKGTIGEVGIISVSGISDIEFDVYMGWIQGRLVFNDRAFGEMINELERWYDIEIIVDDPALHERRMTATFDGDPLSEVLQIISQALQIEFTQEKRQVRFFSPR